jgi:RNA polymerase sigma factor (sigma-70 family)
MAKVPLHAVLHYLRKVSDSGETAELSDGQLLERFRQRRDETAFAALLERHGPLVLGVCDRILHNPHDSEDAFQATFLILVRKAHAIAKCGSVASWLHGVAHRIAVRLKDDIARRRQRERRAQRPPAPDLLEEVVWCDLRSMLDQEVLRLPDRCRGPFVLCYLEGKTNEEAARLLACPKGTVQSRLAHARELLRAALARRGLTLSGGLLATMLPRPTATAASAALTASTIRMALAMLARGAEMGVISTRVLMLVEGALNSMLLSKIKAVVGVVLVVGVLVAGVGMPGWVYQMQAVQSAPSAESASARASAARQLDKVSPAGQPDARKLLHDADPQIRLKAALDLAEQLDEEAIAVLIELLAELPPPQRKLVEQALQRVAEEWSPNPTLIGDDDISRRILRDAWAGWWRNADGQALLAAFKKRTLSPEQTAKALSLIADLGDNVFAKRQRAAEDLVALGPAVVPLLRQALPGADLEQANRLEQCLKKIAKTHDRDALPPVAVRLLALRKPAGASAALLAYVAFTDDEVMKWEVAKALKRLNDPTPDAAVVKALQDTAPVRRGLAGEVLAGSTDADVRAAVRKLLTDADLVVRLRVAVALACAADREAVPVLIDLLADLPGEEQWQALEILSRLAGAQAPLCPAMGDAASRQKCREAWRAWYAAHGAKAKLTPLAVPPPLLGFTTVAAVVNEDPVNSRVVEVDRHGKVRWQFACQYPVDVHVLPGNRVLVSEFAPSRITERDFQGNILWQTNELPSQPLNVQRLANGNTFVATLRHLLEFDADAKTVFHKDSGDSVAACKLPDGQIVYLTANGKCIRLDASGKEVKRFDLGQNPNRGCGLDLTSRGSLLVSRVPQSLALELDLAGNTLWQAQGPSAAGNATSVPRNGHVMVAMYEQGRVLELDRSGKVVWQYQTAGYNPFLARQR